MPDAKVSTTIEGGTAQGVIGAEYVYVENLNLFGGPQLPAQPPQDTDEHAAIPRCPYPGLAYFGPQDSGLFFGRKRAIARLEEAVDRQSLTALVGASGGGKSSVVLAGLAPRLNAQEGWRFTHFRVGNELYKSAFLALARALVPLFSDGPDQMPPFAEIEALAANLEKGREAGGVTLPNVLGACRARNPGKRILVIADQFEEVFTLVEDEAVRGRFIDTLLSGFTPHADGGPPQICLVLTLRADFYGAVLLYQPLADALQGHVENLGPMSRDELREAIVQPAGTVTFESGLVETLLDEVTSRPGSLPLLQFALREMWSLQQSRCIDRTAYDATGGVEGALARRAQSIFDAQTQTGRDAHAVQLFQRLFLRMVTLGEGAQDTRRVVGRQELGEEAWALAQRLAGENNRLVVTTAPVFALGQQVGEVVHEETAEMTHEALIRHWPTLIDWIAQNRAFLLWLQQLKHRVDEWRAYSGDTDTLLCGRPLKIAEDWLHLHQDDFSNEERAYIEAGILTVKAEPSSRSSWPTRRQLVVTGVFASGAVIVASGLRIITRSKSPGFGPTTVGVYRPPNTPFNQTAEGKWLLRNSNTPGNPDSNFVYGVPGDIPVVGDWTGNGPTTIGVYRPPNTPLNQTTEGKWLLRNSNTPGNLDISFFYGGPGDIPVVGDWAGNGTTTIGVYRPPNTLLNQGAEGRWLLRNSNTPGDSDSNFVYGVPGDIPVVGDWTGNGPTTIGVYRPPKTQFNQETEGKWLLRNSNTPGNPEISLAYGVPGDIPVVGDWTGNGTTTIGVYRPPNTPLNRTTEGKWLLRNSNTPGDPDSSFRYGGPGDTPVVGSWSTRWRHAI